MNCHDTKGVQNAGVEFTELAENYGLTYGTPDWLDDVVRRYGLSPATH